MIWMLLLIRHIKIVIIVIFIYRTILLVSVVLSFWQIYVLVFDESFFAKLAAIVSSITLATVNLFTKYLNKIVIVNREIIIGGIITNLQNYIEFGNLFWIVIGLEFVILVIVILKFNLNSI
ncbi:hypothetical protein [Candidatus Vesicomyidisocius sp. SY067_SCS001]|uniref:hypothetical protein n=1 Tax=Candidatus Vesicomyidisocius sp. SY067_SCS001 TaxID=2732590 RepID=UPI0016879356|nr:hypothetical protein [Candidatus Vesicomyosocius sp. SY067_SCS001]